MGLAEKAKKVYAELQPREIVNKYEWLFREAWINDFEDEPEEDETDFGVREQYLKNLRVSALTDIVQERGIPGVLELSEKGKAQRLIGMYLASDVLTSERIEDLIFQCLHSSEDHSGQDELIIGTLGALGKDKRKTIYESLLSKATEEEALRILILSPYRASTWELVDQLSAMAQNRYWMEIVPQYICESPEENNESIRRLLEVGRPRAAFVSLRFELKKVSPPLLVQMLSAMAGESQDKDGEYLLDSYDVRHAFQLLDRNSDLTLEKKAELEFIYVEILARTYPGDRKQIPNLERYVEEHPDLFVRSVVWAYKRDDLGADPAEFRVPEGCEHIAQRAYCFLEAIERIPGQDKVTKEEQREELMEWVTRVRRSCAELGRERIADECIGKLFSHAPVGRDGVWSGEAVRDVMDDLRSEDISIGAYRGLYNARGVHWRREGGGQERELANKYRTWADALQFTHPFVSSTVLMPLVNTYKREAEQHDAEVGIQRRLWH